MMKQFIKTTLCLLGSACMLAACSDDNDSNPTLLEPTTFSLNEPAFANAEIDLATSTAIPFSWSQPAYGFPAAVSYQLEISLTGSYTVPLSAAEADESGATVADYATLDEVFKEAKGQIDAAALAKALQQLAKWPEGSVPSAQSVSVRATAETAGASLCISNVVQIKVNPYYVELKDAAPAIWYLTGGCIANGGWGNGMDAVGTSMMPMYTLPGEVYDKKDGTGLIGYAGYFPAGGEVKIIQNLGSWDYGMCGGTEEGGQSYRNGGDDPGNITVTQAGFYRIELNTATHTMSMTLIDAPKAFATLSMSGDFNGWATDDFMTPITTVDGSENHDWTKSYSGAGGVKFLANSDWGVNWGADTFPYGTGVLDGANIPSVDGSYKVFFNDILGSYYFFSVE